MELRTSVTDVENPQQVEVTLTSEETLVGGLSEVITQENESRPYELVFRICTVCGEEVGSSPEGRFKCIRCRNDNQERFGRITYKTAANKVDSIVSRKTQYKCDTCGRVYDVPTNCCIKNSIIDIPKGSQRAFWCPKCKSVYAMRVACCDKNPDKLLAGTYVRRAG